MGGAGKNLPRVRLREIKGGKIWIVVRNLKDAAPGGVCGRRELWAEKERSFGSGRGPDPEIRKSQYHEREKPNSATGKAQ